jgi:hypothetical protein
MHKKNGEMDDGEIGRNRRQKSAEKTGKIRWFENSAWLDFLCRKV